MYLNLIQIAESFGVSEKIVDDWIRNEGLPHTVDRGRLLFDRAQVTQWAASRGLAARVGFLAQEASTLVGASRLGSLLRSGGIWRDVAGADAIEIFIRVVASLPGVTPPVRHLLARRLRAPGGVTWAPVGGGFALPHPAVRVALGRDAGTIAILFLRDVLAVTEPPPDDEPVRRLVFFIAPSPRAHLDLLARLSRLLARGPLRDLLVRGAADEAIHAVLASAEANGAAGTAEVRA